MTRPKPTLVLAGIGNEYRSDDAAGRVVAALAADRFAGVTNIGPIEDPLDLLGRWDATQAAVVVDAVRSGGKPGTIRVVDLVQPRPPDRLVPTRSVRSTPTSTHGVGLDDVLRLGRAVGSCPGRVVLVGIEGRRFGRGYGLSPEVEIAVPVAVGRVVRVLEELEGVLTCA